MPIDKMSLHDYAIAWVANQIGGISNDARAKSRSFEKPRFYRIIKNENGRHYECTICNKKSSNIVIVKYCCLKEKNELLRTWEKMIDKRKVYKIGKCIPDVIEIINQNKPNQSFEYNEVEVLGIPKKRIESWKLKYPKGGGKYSLMTPSSKRILWVVFPEGVTEAFDKIKIIERKEFGDFSEVNLK